MIAVQLSLDKVELGDTIIASITGANPHQRLAIMGRVESSVVGSGRSFTGAGLSIESANENGELQAEFTVPNKVDFKKANFVVLVSDTDFRNGVTASAKIIVKEEEG